MRQKLEVLKTVQEYYVRVCINGFPNSHKSNLSEDSKHRQSNPLVSHIAFIPKLSNFFQKICVILHCMKTIIANQVTSTQLV